MLLDYLKNFGQKIRGADLARKQEDKSKKRDWAREDEILVNGFFIMVMRISGNRKVASCEDRIEPAEE